MLAGRGRDNIDPLVGPRSLAADNFAEPLLYAPQRVWRFAQPQAELLFESNNRQFSQ